MAKWVASAAAGLLLCTSICQGGRQPRASVASFVGHPQRRRTSRAHLLHESGGDDTSRDDSNAVNAGRRAFLPTAASAAALICNGGAARALECDAKDVLCRQKLYDSYVDSFQDEAKATGQPIPKVTNRISYVVQLIVDIGERRDGDAGYLRFGLYGDDVPGSAKQMLRFLTRGIESLDRSSLDDRLEVEAMPVSLGDGNGSVQNVCPGKGVDFGVPSQSKAFAKSKGVRSAGPAFVPQGRPVPTLEDEPFPRPHDVAGLVTVPAKGIGYASDTADVDEIFSEAFAITAGANPSLDKPKSRWRVIGQVIDDESMRFLDRLANLPVQKKLGVGESGPPLLKVRVRDVDVQKVK